MQAWVSPFGCRAASSPKATGHGELDTAQIGATTSPKRSKPPIRPLSPHCALSNGLADPANAPTGNMRLLNGLQFSDTFSARQRALNRRVANRSIRSALRKLDE